MVGRFGGAFSYDPTPQYFSVPHDQSVSFPDVLTVAVWFYPHTYPADWRPVVAKVEPGTEDANYWIGTYNDTFCVLHHALGSWYLDCSVSYPANQWYLLVGTWDDPMGDYRLYVNGGLAAQYQTDVDLPEVVAPITIGWAPADDGVDGVIDEVVIWHRLLSQQEIQALYVP